MLMIEPNIEADNPLVTQISLVDNISQPAARLLKEPIPLIGSGAHCMGRAPFGLEQTKNTKCLRRCISPWSCHHCFKLQHYAQQLCSEQ